jgi:putative DNA methylase
MRWDTAEGNPFSTSSGNFLGQLGYLTKVIENSPTGVAPATVWQLDAQSASFSSQILSTDPPYYDNVPYADLSDFFYAWLRQSLQPIFPTLFGTIAVPKSEELVADHKRHGSAEAAESFFVEGMSKVMARACTESDSSFPTVIYYAFRQGEKSDGGISSTGWETFVSAVVQAGFAVDGTWPVRTELTGNLKKRRNALASSIILVCRKRSENAPITTRAEFLRALKRELPEAIKLLQHGSIAPVDMAQASIGPGMAIFTRYAKVLESDDSPMTVKTALQLINQALDEYLSEQEAEYDADTRFAITWFETHGMEAGPYGTAETLATARGVAVTGVAEAGILEARGGNVRLLRHEEIPEDWDPATDPRLTVWECTQYLIRALENEGESAAAELLARLGARGEVARDLAYRLYGICERKKWAEEGIAYNGLVVAWPEISKLAAQAGPTGPAEPELGL